MQFQNEPISLSPSDVTAYLGCRHLTTLLLQVAKWELAKPDVEKERAELVFTKGGEHEDAYLRSLVDAGKVRIGGESTHLADVVNSTPARDGTYRRCSLRVPRTMRTARQAVAWTFGFDSPTTYTLAAQT